METYIHTDIPDIDVGARLVPWFLEGHPAFAQSWSLTLAEFSDFQGLIGRRALEAFMVYGRDMKVSNRGTPSFHLC